VLEDTQLVLMQPQTVLMSNKLIQKLEICRSVETRGSDIDAGICSIKPEDSNRYM